MTIGLNDYEFQLDTTGVRLNTDSTGIPFVDINKVSGLDNSPYRETFRDHEGTDGGFLDAEFETGRAIVLDGIVYGDTLNIESYLDTLKQNYAPVRNPIPFYFKSSGVSERFVNVKPRGVRFDWEQARRIGITNIQFQMYAEDPRIYDNDLLSIAVPYGGPATTGFGFNFGFNLSFGATVPASGGIVVVSGNRPTPAIITVTGPATLPSIVNSTDGLTLTFNLTLSASDVLVIDLATRNVTVNGANARFSLIEPNWWLFNPGSTFVIFGGQSGSGTMVISYRNAWR